MSLVGAVKAFNKIGARLLTKETSVKLEEEVFNMGGTFFSMGKKLFHGVTPPKGAVTGSFVQGETQFGQKGFSIVSFFDDSGKLLERSRFSHIRDKVELASHTQYNSRILGTSNGKVSDVAYKKFTNFFKDVKIIKTEDVNTIVDYSTSSPTVTKSIVTNSKGKGNIWYEQAGRNVSIASTKHLTDRLDVIIEQIRKGIQKKSYKASYDFSPNGHFYTDFTGKIQTEGLTPEQVKMLREDKYLPVRLMSERKQQCEYIKKDIFENTGISQRTEIECISDPKARTGGHTDIDKIQINTGRSRSFSSFIDTIAHESRHVWQHDLVLALERGEIKDPKLKKFAEELKYAFEHRPSDYYELGENYRKTLFEKDAYAWGDSYEKTFNISEAPLPKIFNLSNASWFLG